MPNFHVHFSYTGKGQQSGGAANFQRYLSREDRASDFRRYLQRDDIGQGKDDLVRSGQGNLPSWARGDASQFWKDADHLERSKGPVFFHLQAALPRELSASAREDLAMDILSIIVGNEFPYSYAIHEPEARDGSGIQPHIHIQFSSRRDESRLERTAAEWFRQANRTHPAQGGIGKDASWFTKGRLYDVRASIALLTNAALAREGMAVAVDHRSLGAQGIERPATRAYHRFDEGQIRAVQNERHTLRDSGVTTDEQAATYARWQVQAATLPSLDRAYIRDRCTYHVWRYDTSPSRVAEREASRQRMDTVIRNSMRMRNTPRQEASPEDLTRRWELPLIGNKNSLIYHTYEQANYGDVHPNNQVRFWTEQEAQDAGYRRAANDHYGPGSGKLMTIEEAQAQFQRFQEIFSRQRQGQRVNIGRGYDENNARGHILAPDLSHAREKVQGLSW